MLGRSLTSWKSLLNAMRIAAFLVLTCSVTSAVALTALASPEEVYLPSAFPGLGVQREVKYVISPAMVRYELFPRSGTLWIGKYEPNASIVSESETESDRAVVQAKINALASSSSSTTKRGELVVTIALGVGTALDVRDSYVVEETLYVKITVKDSLTGEAVPNVSFHCPLYNSQSHVIIDYWGTTDANGEWTIEMEFANESYLGTWSLEVNEVSAEGYENWSVAENSPSGFTVIRERPPEEDGAVYLVGSIVLVLAVAVVMYFRRRASARSATLAEAAPAATVAYRENCGRSIAAWSVYCPHCGDRQGE